MSIISDWERQETSTHQDHVIAHVLGAKVLGFFVCDETLHVLLDIGFIWTIFVDGQMGLLPHPVTVSELEVDERNRNLIANDIDYLLTGNEATKELARLKLPDGFSGKSCVIESVEFFARNSSRRLMIKGDEVDLLIETSLTTAAINVYEN